MFEITKCRHSEWQLRTLPLRFLDIHSAGFRLLQNEQFPKKNTDVSRGNVKKFKGPPKASKVLWQLWHSEKHAHVQEGYWWYVQLNSTKIILYWYMCFPSSHRSVAVTELLPIQVIFMNHILDALGDGFYCFSLGRSIAGTRGRLFIHASTPETNSFHIPQNLHPRKPTLTTI